MLNLTNLHYWKVNYKLKHTVRAGDQCSLFLKCCLGCLECFRVFVFDPEAEQWNIAHRQIRTISCCEETTNLENVLPLERKGEVMSSASRMYGVIERQRGVLKYAAELALNFNPAS